MKNADMPAMPIVDADATTMSHQELSDWRENSCLGLTKREMMAMHMMASLISPMMDDVLEYNDSKEWLNNMTESAVEMADALLAELDRTAK